MSFDTQKAIKRQCNLIADLLCQKNAKYGNAALEPRRILSKCSPMEQIAVRIDDKLSRIATVGMAGADEDTVLDLIGYLVLLRIAREYEGKAEAEEAEVK
jgi:hypothetical protein